MKRIETFTDLNAWKEAHQLVLMIYLMTKEFPKEEQYSLVDQMRRAAVSITSNIAEGFGRDSYQERTRFYQIARGSLAELQNQSLISKDLQYMNQEQYLKCETQVINAYKLLNGLISKTKSFIKNPPSNLQAPSSNL